MPNTVVVTDVQGLGGKKFVCTAYKRGPSGKLRCAEKRPSRGHCYRYKGKKICSSTSSAISKRSKIGKRAKVGFVAGLGQCRNQKGHFTRCR